ncbi:MAG: enoyl-CoA hydratase [Chloroflexota bacterium]|jgi:enoyl-CoA hydratase|nr:enoyl-CoA hydratase [Chloroflexota bacterium]
MEPDRIDMPHGGIYVERTAPVARIVFNRPEQNNPMNDEWREDLEAALELLRRDNDISVVIIKGNGKSLSSGGDLQALNSFFGGSRFDDRQNSLRIGRFLYRTVWQFPKPIILQVHGYCIGGGISLMGAADIVIIEEGARIGSPEARALGFEPFLGFWAMTLGPRWAKMLVFTGDSIDGKTAAEIGMVTKAVPLEELEGYVEWLAARIATNGYDTLSIQKEAVNSAFEILGMEAIMKSTMVYNHLAHSSDRASQFLDKIKNDGIREAVSWRDEPFGGAQRMGGWMPLVDGPPPPAPPSEETEPPKS